MHHRSSRRVRRPSLRAFVLGGTFALAVGCAAPNAERVALEPVPYAGAAAVPARSVTVQDDAPTVPGSTAREVRDTNWEFRVQPSLRGGVDDDFDPIDGQLAVGVGVGFSPPEWYGFGADFGTHLGIGYEKADLPAAEDSVLLQTEIYGGPRYTLILDALAGGRLQPYVGGGLALVAGAFERADGSEFEDASAALYGIVGIQYAFSHFSVGTEFRLLRGSEFDDSDPDTGGVIDSDLDYEQLSFVFAFRL